ncbi:MAG: hypothetical protein ABR552_09745 [Actinomycetota bacterium]|nr:hypothetical protein [Actinomycetota bacterium]
MHEIAIAGCEDPNGPFLAGCRCGWTAEIRPHWSLALDDARRHLEQLEAGGDVEQIAS